EFVESLEAVGVVDAAVLEDDRRRLVGVEVVQRQRFGRADARKWIEIGRGRSDTNAAHSEKPDASGGDDIAPAACTQSHTRPETQNFRPHPEKNRLTQQHGFWSVKINAALATTRC